MDKNEMFIIATRNKLRFPFRGLITVEDLWDLSLTNLDNVFKTLNAKSKQSQEESLLNIKTEEDEILNIQIEIVKYIVSVKLTEKHKEEQERLISEKKQKIMSIIAAKQDEALNNSSIEELQKMLNEIE